jgi:hypothetical protein
LTRNSDANKLDSRRDTLIVAGRIYGGTIPSMATGHKRIFWQRSDAIRVVPLYAPEALKPAVGAPIVHAAPPILTYRNGPLLASVEVFTIFWGDAWQAAQAGLVTQINGFFDFILTSALIDQLSEYSVPAYKIGHGKRSGTITITSPAITSSVSDTAIQHMLQTLVSGHAGVPAPTPNSLYFIYLPPGVTVVQGGGASCQAFCGYHNDISGQIFYAVMPYPGCAGCAGGLAPFDALTSTSSHELCEAITDPIPGQGWYDDANGEIGDICAWKTKVIGTFTVQLEWSNSGNQCV